MSAQPAHPRFTYDEVADAVYLYLTGPIGPGEVARSSLVPLLRPGLGASMFVGLDESGNALGLEFLGASNLFTPETLEALRVNRTPFSNELD